MSTAVASISTMHGHKFVSVTTFRKDGTPIAVPMMFAEGNGRLYLVTGKTAGKLKRIRRNPQVTFAPSDSRGTVLGETTAAHARILTDEEWATIKSGLHWSLPAPMRFIFNRIRAYRGNGLVYLEITIA